MNLGHVAGVLGVVAGVAFAGAVTWLSAKNAQGPRERAFAIKSTIAFFVIIAAFILAAFTLPRPYRYWLWLPYVIVLPYAIVKCNRRQAGIRREEESDES